MTVPSTVRPPDSRMLALAPGGYALLGGLLSFLGWVLNIHQLTDWFSLGISIQPNSTVAAMAGGGAVLAIAFSRFRIAAVLGGISLVIGSLAIGQTIAGLSFGTDTFLMFDRPWGNTATVAPGRIGTPGSISWMVLGMGAILAGGGWKRRRVVVILGLFATLLGTLSMLGYLYQANLLFAVPRYTAIALQTSTFVIAIGVGLIVTQTDRQPMAALVERTGAGLLLRRALPVVILVPIALGWLRTIGEEAGLYDRGMGRSLLILTLVVIMVAGLWWISRGVDRHERRIREAERRQALLADLGQLFTDGREARSVLVSVCRDIARHFGVSRCGYSSIDLEAGQVTVEHDFAESGLTSLVGTYPLDQYAGFYREDAAGGRVIAIPDTAAATSRDYDARFAPLEVRSTLVVPIHREGRWVANFWLSHHRARGWTPDDVTLMRTLADRVQAAVENAEYIANLQRTSAQLQQAGRMEAVGRLAAGLAHDFNNQLHAVAGLAAFIARDPRVTGQSREDLEQIRQSAERIASLVRQLLAFSRQQVLVPETIELGAAVFDARPLLRQFLGPVIELRLASPPSPVWIQVDRAQFHQVLMNLVINARDAMPSGGTITISVSAVEVTARGSSWREARPGQYGCLMVSDTGQGIPPAVLPYIFEPFFTTKDVGQGTGLGLATVHGIVTQSHGYIDVQSEPTRGARFSVLLPIAPEPPRRVLSGRSADGRNHDGRILVVEDEPVARGLLRRALEDHGYQVVVARDGADALKQLGQDPDVDLVISDVVMPVMGGAELAEVLASRYPETPVIWVSGYPRSLAFQGGKIHDNQPFFQKPFRTEDLLATVADQLDGHRRLVSDP